MIGETDSSLFGRAIPIAGNAGDQQAALFGQVCTSARHVKEHLRHGLLYAAKHRYGACEIEEQSADDHRLAD